MNIPIVGKEVNVGGRGGVRQGTPKSYRKILLTKEEIKGAEGLALMPIELGEPTAIEAGEAKVFQTGAFTFHHPRYLMRTRDGKVHGLRLEGGEILGNGKLRYEPPNVHDGQQITTCADPGCGRPVLLHQDYLPGDVSLKGGAYCLDCVIGHPERRIPIIFVDYNLRFKTVYNHMNGAYITNMGVMRSYVGEAWREEYNIQLDDSIQFLRVVNDSFKLFTDNIFVRVIKKGER